MCALSGFGPIWWEAPFSEDDDQVVVLPSVFAVHTSVLVEHFLVAVTEFQEVTSFDLTYWCFHAGLGNASDDRQSFNIFEFSLLTPSGRLENATIPLVDNIEDLLGSGEVSPEGVAEGFVCFDRPSNPSGRFAVVYEPLTLFGSGRALFYFDR